MRFASLIFVLCLICCICNGAPPKEVGSSSSSRSRKTSYTEEEDRFIVDELLRVPTDTQQIFSQQLWESIGKKHQEKWKQKVPGFPCERTGKGLRERLVKSIMRNSRSARVKLPETLLRRFPLLVGNRPKQAPRYPYTPEETNFISEELSQPSYKHLYASSTWDAIKTIHDAKRSEGCQGFIHERTVASLRKHMEVMKQSGQLPNEILKKFGITIQGDSSSGSSPPRETTELQETTEYYEDDDEWVEAMLRSLSDITAPDLG